jgi:hypothetical protein
MTLNDGRMLIKQWEKYQEAMKKEMEKESKKSG